MQQPRPICVTYPKFMYVLLHLFQTLKVHCVNLSIDLESTGYQQAKRQYIDLASLFCHIKSVTSCHDHYVGHEIKYEIRSRARHKMTLIQDCWRAKSSPRPRICLYPSSTPTPTPTPTLMCLYSSYPTALSVLAKKSPRYGWMCSVLTFFRFAA